MKKIDNEEFAYVANKRFNELFEAPEVATPGFSSIWVNGYCQAMKDFKKQSAGEGRHSIHGTTTDVPNFNTCINEIE